MLQEQNFRRDGWGSSGFERLEMRSSHEKIDDSGDESESSKFGRTQKMSSTGTLIVVEAELNR